MFTSELLSIRSFNKLFVLYTFATLTAHGSKIRVGTIAASRLIPRLDDIERLLTRHLS